MSNMIKSVRTYALDTSNPVSPPSTDTLAAPITTSDTAITLTGTGGVTATQNGCFISINNDLMQIASGGGTTSLVVIRSGTAASHSTGDTVSLPGFTPFYLLPTIEVPNQDFYIYKATPDLNYVVVICYSTDSFRDGFTSKILADASDALGTLHIHAPDGSTIWIQTAGAGGGAGGGGGVSPPAGATAPPVTIDPVADVIFRGDHKVEVDVDWTPSPLATPQNFLGVQVYLEDPDISSGSENPPLGDGTVPGDGVPLDGSVQPSGDWAPIPISESPASPAIVPLDSGIGSIFGQTFKAARNVRIYLASYGPFSHPHLVRATDTTETPTPNIMVNIPLGRGSGEGGQEWAFLVTDLRVEVSTDYNRPDPKYYLTFFYKAPGTGDPNDPKYTDPASPVPPGMNHFGGVRIKFVYEDASGNPMFDPGSAHPPADTGINIPVSQSQIGYKSDPWDAGPIGGQFRCYFCSEDDSQPLGHHVNSLIEGVTPYKEAIIPPVPSTPNVGKFTISGQQTVWLWDQSMVAEAAFSWDLPTTDQGSIRYSGVFLYLVNVTGTGSPLTKFPMALTEQMSNRAVNVIKDVANVPDPPEVWTIAAISVSNNGVLKDEPKDYGKSSFTSPTVTWNIGPPKPGDVGSGQEFAPFVTINAGASVTDAQSLSTDGVRMVSFSVGSWTNPDDNQFGGVQVAMVIAQDVLHAQYWPVPANATSFITPDIPSFGNVTSDPNDKVWVDFFIVSQDPQGNRNSLQLGTTPHIHYDYKPTSGSIIPARSGWFSAEFKWPDGGSFAADSFAAQKILVGSQLIVGGAPTSFSGNTVGSRNGQVAVLRADGSLAAWMGQAEPGTGQQGQGSNAGVYGGWFGNLYVGGTNPLDAPFFIDAQGIVQVGGIAAAHGSKYPYVSVRDQYGTEMGRIGAQLGTQTNLPGDGVGTSPPPELTAGAWFKQLAIGGSTLTNWNVLIVPDPNNIYGSQFLMRNIRTLQIDYPNQSGGGFGEAPYQMLFGSNVWVGAPVQGQPTQWQFPGIHIFEIDNVGNDFGATYLNRGMVLRGHKTQGYPPLVSLVMYNGNPTGSDEPTGFWGELAMYSPSPSFNRTVYLASGSDSTPNPQLTLLDNATMKILFQADPSGNVTMAGELRGIPEPIHGATTPVRAYAYSVTGYGQVIDPTGKWVGPAIPAVGGQSPWTQDIIAQGFALKGAGNISAAQYLMAGGTSPVIDVNGAFLGSGIDLTRGATPGGIKCGAINATTPGEIDCGLVWSRNNIVCGGTQPGSLSGSGWVAADNIKVVGNIQANQYLMANGNVFINANGAFIGGGVDVGGEGIACGGLTTRVQAPGIGDINCYGRVYSAGPVYGSQFLLGVGQGGPVIDTNGTFRGSGVICYGTGIGVGSITVANVAPGQPGFAYGPITCGSITVAGAVSFGSITSPGSITGQSYWVGGTQVINANGAFIGPGCDVGVQGIGCGYLAVRANYVDCQEVRCGSGIANVGGNGNIGCVQLNTSSAITCNGWALTQADHTVYCSQLIAYSWSGGIAVISTGGVFQGPGIVLYNRGNVNCGSIEMNGGNINNSGSISMNGQLYAPNGSVLANNYQMPGVGYVINPQGQFVGHGVLVYGYGIGCNYLNMNGGNIDGVANLSSSAQISSNTVYSNYIQSNGNVYAGGIYQGGAFKGSGVDVGGYGIGGGSLITTGNCAAGQFGVYGYGYGTWETVYIPLPGGGQIYLYFKSGIYYGHTN